MDNFDWVDKQEEKRKEERSKEYFDIVEGRQQFVLLSHCAPLAQVFEGGKYRYAEEGDKNISIKGLCWVLQSDEEKSADGTTKRVARIKSAKLPYVVVKAIRALQQDPEWDFKLPFPHLLTLNAEGAGTKEVKYSLTPSPREVEIPADILAEYKKKPSPEELAEKIKGGKKPAPEHGETDYPEEDIDLSAIPF